MNELPMPIRRELEEYLKNNSPAPPVLKPPPPPPAPSTTTTEICDPIAEQSFTQVMDHIDESVLNELPPEMRREIAMAQKLRKIESKYPPIGVKRPVPTSAPSNPTTTNNAFNVLMNSPKKPITTKKTSNPMRKYRTETNLQEESIPPIARTEIKPVRADVSKQPSIAGCKTLSEVKLMLREWIESSDEPNQIDLELFENYLIDLLNSYNAEMVHQLLVYGLIQLKTLMKTTWNQLFQNVINAVQNRFCQMYGGAKMDLSE